MVGLESRFAATLLSVHSQPDNCQSVGVTSPLSAGVYLLVGLHNGQPLYYCAANSMYLSWDGNNAWILSLVVYPHGDNYWSRQNVSCVGAYVQRGSYTGAPTVSAYP